MATRRQVRPSPSDEWGPLPLNGPRGPRRVDRLRWLERVLMVLAFVGLGYYAYVSAETLLYQAVENRELDAILNSRRTVESRAINTSARKRVSRPKPGSTIGRIEIPRLRVSAVIRTGTDARTLRLAVGHIPGTAFPGEDGNVGLAGHRDTFFRRLRDIQTEDEIRVATPEGVYRYRVERTHVVDPEDVWVLDASRRPSLTLVTCYPFSYVGSAPQRFIVRAELDRGGH